MINLDKYIIHHSNGYKKQVVLKFPNNYGASLVQGPYTYGGKEGLYEIAVLSFDNETWQICYDTPITDDVIGYLTEKEVMDTLQQIFDLGSRIEHEIIQRRIN
mgnify:FL=1|jgi:hypothetical protein